MASDVKIKVEADTNQLQTGLNSAGNSVNAFAAKTTLAGTAVKKMEAGLVTAGAIGSKAMAGLQAAMGPILAAIGALMGLKGIFDEFGKFQDLADRFNVTAETMQRLSVVADASGTSLEIMVKGLQKAEINAIKAQQGNSDLADSFAALGINTEAFLSMSPEEKLLALSKGFSEAKNQGDATAAMMDILGKAGREMQALLAGGSEALKQQFDNTYVAASKNVAAIDDLGDRMGKAWSQIKAGAADALGATITLIGGMLEKAERFSIVINNIGKGWTEANKIADGVMERKKEREDKAQKIKEEAAKNRGKVDTDAVEEKAKAKEEAKSKDKDAGKMSSMEDYKKVQEEERKKQEFLVKSQGQWSSMDDLKKIKADAKAKAKAEKDAKKDVKEGELDAAGASLGLAKAKQSANHVDSDQLRKIGGGFAKSNYSGVPKEEQRLQKQVDLAQKQYDELKKVVEALKNRQSTDGIND